MAAQPAVATPTPPQHRPAPPHASPFNPTRRPGQVRAGLAHAYAGIRSCASRKSADPDPHESRGCRQGLHHGTAGTSGRQRHETQPDRAMEHRRKCNPAGMGPGKPMAVSYVLSTGTVPDRESRLACYAARPLSRPSGNNSAPSWPSTPNSSTFMRRNSSRNRAACSNSRLRAASSIDFSS